MRILSEPLAWIVVLRVACGLWFFASGVRKANRNGIGLVPPQRSETGAEPGPSTPARAR